VVGGVCWGDDPGGAGVVAGWPDDGDLGGLVFEMEGFLVGCCFGGFEELAGCGGETWVLVGVVEEVFEVLG